MCLIGKKLEDFTVPAYYKKEITEISLSQVLGHWSVFIFYPADFSFVCPTELEEMERDFTKVLHLKDHAQLYGLPSMTRHAATYLEPAAVLPLDEVFADWQPLRPRTGDLLDDLRFLRDRLTGAGYDVIAVDQTTPEQHRMGLHTVSALVPGLLPLDFGWSRQRAPRMPRMRTALRTAGRRPDDLPEAEIKAAPHPFP